MCLRASPSLASLASLASGGASLSVPTCLLVLPGGLTVCPIPGVVVFLFGVDPAWGAHPRPCPPALAGSKEGLDGLQGEGGGRTSGGSRAPCPAQERATSPLAGQAPYELPGQPAQALPFQVSLLPRLS